MQTHFPELTTLKKAFGKQHYHVMNDAWKAKLLRHPLIKGVFTVGKSFIIVANTFNWDIEIVTGDTLSLTGYSKDEISRLKGEFVMSYPIPDHIDMNMATVKACMEYSNNCPFEQREFIFGVYYYAAKKKNGEIVIVQHQSIPMVFDDNKIPFIFCNIYSDISHLDAVNIPQGMMINKFTDEVFHVNRQTQGLEKKENLFSNREKEIIMHLSAGLTSKQIGEILFISSDTVRTHRKNILSKAGISNTTTLIKYCIVNGIL
jgi:DNA-binding CsgD family transcriptional regulator